MNHGRTFGRLLTRAFPDRREMLNRIVVPEGAGDEGEEAGGDVVVAPLFRAVWFSLCSELSAARQRRRHRPERRWTSLISLMHMTH